MELLIGLAALYLVVKAAPTIISRLRSSKGKLRRGAGLGEIKQTLRSIYCDEWDTWKAA